MLTHARLSASSEELKDVLSVHPAQEEVSDPVTAKLSVDREGLAGGELDLLLSLAGHLDSGDQSNAEAGETIGDPDLVSGFPVGGDLEVAYGAGGGDAVEVGRNEDKADLLETCQRDGLPGHGEGGADHDGGLGARTKSLAVEANTGVELVGFRRVLEVGEAGEAIGGFDDGGARAGLVGEGDEGAALFVTFIAVASEPDGDSGGWFARFIKDGDHFSPAAGGGEDVESALADDGPAALAASDEFDDPYSAPVFDLGKLEIAGDPALRSLLVVEGTFVVGDQPVEVEVGTDLGAVLEVVIEGVHLKDLHDQGLHVLEVNAEADFVADTEVFRIVGIELDVDPILQGLELAGAQQGGPTLGVTDPVDDLGFGKDRLEPALLEVGSVGLVVSGFPEEMKEIVPDDRFVGAGRGQSGHVAEVLAKICGVTPELALLSGPVRMHVGCTAGELDVCHEAVGIMHALGVIKDQTLVEKVCLQGIEGGSELGDELPGAFQVSLADLRTGSWIGVGARAQLGEVGVNVICVEEEVLPPGTQFIELGDGECAMNVELAEPSALLAFKIPQDESDQPGEIGVVGATEEITPLGSGEGMPAGEQGEEFIPGDILQGPGVSEGISKEFVP